MAISVEDIAKKFASRVEKDVYDNIVKYLRSHFTTLKIEPTRPLILDFTFFLEKGSPIIGYSSSEADIVIFLPQKELPIDKDNLLLRNAGK